MTGPNPRVIMWNKNVQTHGMLQPLVFPAPSIIHIKQVKSFNAIRNGTWQIITGSVPHNQKPHTIYHTIHPLIKLDVFHQKFACVA